MANQTTTSPGTTSPVGQTETPDEASQASASQTGRTAEAAGRDAQSLLRETGYAALGTFDLTVAAARRLAQRSTKLPDVVAAAPGVLRDTFETLSDRGRTLTGQIKRDPQVKAAKAQTEAAVDLATSAVSSAGRAAESQAGAVQQAARDVATSKAPAPSRQELRAMTVVELRDLAATCEVQGYYSLNKEDLVEAIAQAQSSS